MQSTNDLNDKLMEYKNECGCANGARFMLAAFVISMTLVIREYGLISISFLTRIPLLVLIAILAAGLGKTIGILYARYQYKQLSKRLTANQSI